MKDKNIETAEYIAREVKKQGGTAYYAGGCVRDRIMGIESADTDIEIHGVAPAVLEKILSGAGEVISIGESFGIYSLKGFDIDIALPRKEKCTGRGHRDFEVLTDPYIGTYKAALRRDFTVNAMMEDVLTGEITDYFGGMQDIENRVLRHVNDESFCEDPLRVLRLAQFAARFGFSVSEDTAELCRKTDITSLSRERVFAELKKALLKAPSPSVFFEVLKSVNALSCWFPEVENLIGVPQNPVYHPEGDVWTHTMAVLDCTAEYKDRVSNTVGFMLSAICHDFGKAVCTTVKNGRIVSYNHEIEGLPIVKKFLGRLTDEKKLTEYVLNIVRLHMRPNFLVAQHAGMKSSNHMFDEALSPEDLIYFSQCDSLYKTMCNEEELFSRLEVYRNIMSKPCVTGRDLIKAGLEPDDNFSDILAYAHKLRLSGLDKKTVLRQTLTYSKKLKKA